MQSLRNIRKPIVLLTAASFFATVVPLPAAQAALVGTDRVVAQQETAGTRAKLERLLSRDDVRQQIQSMGVSPEEAKARVASMTDEELAQVSGQLDSLPAGQGVGGAILGAALIVFIVLLITDIFGFTKVFGFVNHGSAR